MLDLLREGERGEGIAIFSVNRCKSLFAYRERIAIFMLNRGTDYPDKHRNHNP